MVLQQRVIKVTELILDLVNCRSPSPVYTLFLKDQMINFQLSQITQGLNPSLHTPQEFYVSFKSVLMALQNLLYELYIHNFVFLDDKDWNSLLYMGDVQFRAVMSWMQNEISKENQATPYREKEMFEPLYIQPQVQNIHKVFFDWLSLNNNQSVATKIHLVWEQAFLDCEQHCSTIAPNAIQASIQRWI